MKFLIFILIFVGMFMISGSLLKLPPYSTSQRLRSISGKAGMTEMLKQRLLLPVIKIVALIVHLDDFKERRMQIKLERAGFIFTPLESYSTIAGKGLQYDIEVLILDLKSGNFENAMIDFENRVGNAYMSRLAKSLIAINRGDNQEASLNHLLSDMSLLSHETMCRELNKRPGRVKMMVIPIVVIGIFTLFYVVGVNLFDSLGGIM